MSYDGNLNDARRGESGGGCTEEGKLGGAAARSVVRERPRRATVGRGGRARRGDDVEGRRAWERDCKREGGAEKCEEVRGVWGREGGAEEEVVADGSNPIGEGGERLGFERERGEWGV